METKWVAPWSLAAIALAIVPGLLFYYDVTPKVALLYCATALTLPFVNARRLMASAAGRWFCAILAAMFVSLAVSGWLSARTDLSIFGSTWRRFGLITQSAVLLFAFVVAADLAGGAERLRAYLRASTVATVLIACYAILQYLGWDPWIDPRTYHVGSGIWTIVRPPGTLGYVTYLANYLVFGVFQGLALYRVERNGVGLAAVVLGSTAVVLSGTRAGIAALVAGALVVWALERQRFTRRAMMIAASVSAVVILFYGSPAGQQLRGRMRWFREDPTGGSRLYLWRDSTSLVARHWLKGAGPETFSVVFPQVQSRELSRAFPEFYNESAHNMFLDAGTAQGLPGLLLLLAAVVFGVWTGRGSPVLLAGFLAVVVCHQFSVFTVPTALTFWVSLAMLLPAGGAASSGRRMLWLLPVSLVLLLAAARLLIGDWHLGRMREAANASRLDVANAEYVAAGRWGMHADLWYSRKLLTSGPQPAQALVSGLSAIITADDPYNAWMNLGLIYAKLNDVGGTERCIRQAIAASPNWYKPHLALAQLMLTTNRAEEGRRELERAKDLDPGL